MNSVLACVVAILALVSVSTAATVRRQSGCEFEFFKNATGGIYRLDLGGETFGVKFNDDGSYETLSPTAPELSGITGFNVSVWDGTFVLGTEGDLELTGPTSHRLSDESSLVRGDGWNAHFYANLVDYAYAFYLEGKLILFIDNECKLKTMPASELNPDQYLTLYDIQNGRDEPRGPGLN